MYASERMSHKIVLPSSGSLPSEFYRYLTTVCNSQVVEACLPLKNIGINYFSYIKRQGKNSYISLSNLYEWQKYFYENHNYLKTDFEKPGEKYQAGCYLWSELSCQDVYHALYQQHSVRFGFTLVKDLGNDIYEFYHFGSSVDHNNGVNFYLSHLNLLERFIQFFKNKTNSIIKEAEKTPLAFPEITKTENPVINNKYIESFMQQTMTLLPDPLTRREIECLKWYALGKTSTEISMLLGISSRTVESHIYNLKNKTGCYNKIQLCKYAEKIEDFCV